MAQEPQVAPPLEDAEDTSLTEQVEAGYHAVAERAFDAKDQLERLNAQAVTLIQEQPVVAIGIAFGVGYLLGAFASRRWIV